MILASIWIGPPGRGEDLSLPPMVRENIASLKKHHLELPHYLFSGEDIEAFLEAKFPKEVQSAYRALRPFAYKADLARYCILHELGGAYADLAFYFIRPVPFDGNRPTVFRDLLSSSPWDTSNSVIVAPPRHKALELAIEMVCANVASAYYGPTPQSPTGPAVFGKALATTCLPEELVTGASAMKKREVIDPSFALPLLPERVHCLICPVQQRTLIAVKRKRKTVRGIAALGVASSDNYEDRWNNRDVYETD